MTRVVIINEQEPARDTIFNLAASLEKNIEVSTFGDPLEALSNIRTQTPDLLIADDAITSMETCEFLRRFRDEPECQNVPAVIVTAHDSIGFRSIAFKPGTTEFLLAPIDDDEFRLRSRNLLSIHRARLMAYRSPKLGTGSESDAEYEKSRIEQIEMFNGLIQTLSSKLLLKINELDRLRGELRNIADLTVTPAIFVDEQLRIRHFTDAAMSMYNLDQCDIGRSLTEVECFLNYLGLHVDFEAAIKTGEPVSQYLERCDGAAHFLMRISPNRSRDGMIWGAAITFTKVGAWYRGDA
jgi:DNA-binding response OmpR family regulator